MDFERDATILKFRRILCSLDIDDYDFSEIRLQDGFEEMFYNW